MTKTSYRTRQWISNNIAPKLTVRYIQDFYKGAPDV